MQPEALLAHQPFVRELARTLTFGSEDPEDVVQQTWVRALENPPDERGPVRGWLATVARNVLRQSRRARLRRSAREALFMAPERIPTPEEIREQEETRREVVDAVLALAEPYRTSIILRYYEDLPPRQIAARLGEPVETVKTRLVRARRMLRERLDKKHGRDGLSWGLAVGVLAFGKRRATAAMGSIAKLAAVVVIVAALSVTAVSIFSSPEVLPKPSPPPTGEPPAAAPARADPPAVPPAEPSPAAPDVLAQVAAEAEGKTIFTVVLPEGAEPPEEFKITSFTKRGMNSSVEIDRVPFDRERSILILDLPKGRITLGFEAPGLWGDLPAFEADGEGKPSELKIALKRRSGLWLRLVDGKGRRVHQGEVKVQVLLNQVHKAGGTVNSSTDYLGDGITNEKGELDLTKLVPAPNRRLYPDGSIGFALTGDGIFAGSMMLDNHRISVDEIATLTEAKPTAPLYLDIPATPWRAFTALVRTPGGKPVAGVRVAARPVEQFVDAELTSDENGRVEVRLLRAPAFGPGRPEWPKLIAQAPWVGSLGFETLVPEPFPGGPPRDLLVRKSMDAKIQLVDEAGAPIRSTGFKLNQEDRKTDDAGRFGWTIPDRWTQVRISVPGYIPKLLGTDRLDTECVVMLIPGRELSVRAIRPEGTTGWVQIQVFEPGKKAEMFRMVRYDKATAAQVFMVPKRTVKIVVDQPQWKGSATAGPDVSEVELRLERK